VKAGDFASMRSANLMSCMSAIIGSLLARA
jgi:hypothetical protein